MMSRDPWDGIECDWHKEPKPGAVENAIDLINAARQAGMPPEMAATGYTHSVCLFWDGGRTEVEVNQERKKQEN